MTDNHSIHCEILVTGGRKELAGQPRNEVSFSAVISTVSINSNSNSNSKIFFVTCVVTPAMGLYGPCMSNRGRGTELPPVTVFEALEESAAVARRSSPDPEVVWLKIVDY